MGTIAQLFESGEHSSKKGMFNNLVMIARVDGKIDNDEIDLLNRFAERLSLTSEQVKEIIENPNSYPMIPPVNKRERLERFVQFVQMTNVDGVIDPKEEALIGKYGIALGIDSEKLENIEQTVINDVKAGASMDDILIKVL